MKIYLTNQIKHRLKISGMKQPSESISREITSESALGIFPGKSVAAGESGLLSVELKINMQVPT
jgi:hypothetical protein